jgi:hypothetical protein
VDTRSTLSFSKIFSTKRLWRRSFTFHRNFLITSLNALHAWRSKSFFVFVNVASFIRFRNLWYVKFSLFYFRFR